MKVHIKHYRNSLTHYKAWEKLRALMLGDYWKYDHRRCVKMWEYVCEYVSAPALDELSPNGGMTTVDVLIDGTSYYSQAYCSILDRYINRVGVNVALKKMLAQNPDMPREHRVLVGGLIRGRR